jgi:hypothetical protein
MAGDDIRPDRSGHLLRHLRRLARAHTIEGVEFRSH